MDIKKLNLGCGRNIKHGWINLDSAALDGVDVIHNIEYLPLPFKDEEFDLIRCDNILEHVNYIPVLQDLYRILKPNGQLEIRVPHFTSRNNYVDPTHRNSFSISTFDFFVKNQTDNDYYFDFHFSKITCRKIKFLKKGIFWFNRIIEPLVNLSSKSQIFYERSFLQSLFPANDIIVELIK